MRHKRIWLGGLFTIAAAAAGIAAHGSASGDLVVHEWGTFLAMSGSDGVALEGMYHEEHALPDFVHARSRDQLRIPSVILKGETPVIYFYTGEAQRVRVDVRFPAGVWTQWYPQAQVAGPHFSMAGNPAAPRNGRLVWCADLVPATQSGMKNALPPTSAGALWNYAREVDAAYVTTPNRTVNPARRESERFLFYRGLGAAPLPVRFTPADGGTLESGPNDTLGVQHVFVVRIEGGKGAYVYRPELQPGERANQLIPPLDQAKPLDEMTRQLADDLASKLVESGLYPKEARAMVNTWRTSYFQTEGTRVLFVLPQAWTDAFIPLAIEPRPKQIVRVMVGRIELLAPEREERAVHAIRDLSAPESEVRAQAFGYLRDQGRYVEPIVRRVLQTTKEAEVKQLCQRLLATDFVTELRAAVHSATDGARLTEDPTYLRAQLAILLREVGLIDQARAEGQRALAELTGRVEPPTENADARGYLRAYARAIEATGDDRAALDAYGRFIRFGSQVAAKRDCRGCHRDAGPQDVAWFHDWWAGAKYAALAEQLGIEPAIATAEAQAARNPSDACAHMLLAYLYRAKGRPERAQTHWATLDAAFANETLALGK